MGNGNINLQELRDAKITIKKYGNAVYTVTQTPQ